MNRRDFLGTAAVGVIRLRPDFVEEFVNCGIAYRASMNAPFRTMGRR
jgi:hypothetical protein